MKRVLAAVILCLSVPAFAKVGLEDRQGKRVAIENLRFHDEAGNEVPLAKYFHAKKPVILALVYFGCPSTCTVLLNNFIEKLNVLSPSSGVDFDVVAVSIDASEGPELARAKKDSYLKMYPRVKTQPGTADGWHFLTGSEANVQKLAAAVGYSFERQPDGLIAHPAALFFLTEDGVLARALPGLAFSKRDLLAAYYESSHGLIDRLFTRLAVFCNGFAPKLEFSWQALLAALSMSAFLGLYLRGSAASF